MATSNIQTRNDFKEYCLRRLGKPVIEINVDDQQVEDRIDEALKYYWDYHFDGTEKIFYKYQITAQDIANGWIPVAPNIIGVVRIFPIGDYIATNNIFNIRYQIALNDLYTLTYQSMVPYYMAFQQLQLLEQLLVGEQQIRYNRHGEKLYIDTDWTKLTVGSYVVAEAYQIVDPEVYSDVWNDRWLQRYAAALIKRQWGTNLTKFVNMTLPGGVQYNGERILDDAEKEIEKYEQEMISSYSLPVVDMIG